MVGNCEYIFENNKRVNKYKNQMRYRDDLKKISDIDKICDYITFIEQIDCQVLDETHIEIDMGFTPLEDYLEYAERLEGILFDITEFRIIEWDLEIVNRKLIFKLIL